MKTVFSWMGTLCIATLILAGCQTSGLPDTGSVKSTVAALATQISFPASTAAASPFATQPVPATTAPQATEALPAATCTAPATLTPALTEGPYFKANSPERSSLLEAGMAGTKLTLTGYVLTADCKPVAHALLDFWQANSQGQYDNSGYTLRGHQYTDANGRYQLETVVPGLYPGRTEHIHVKVQAPGGKIITTQLFFPNVVNNQSDQIFDPALVITVQNTNQGLTATYNFVVSQ